MSDKKKLFTTEHLNDFLQQNYRTPHQILEEGGALNEATAGLLQTDVPEPTPSFIAAKSTKRIRIHISFLGEIVHLLWVLVLAESARKEQIRLI
jgi:hypothetical protein